jgi:hypothetical protein
MKVQNNWIKITTEQGLQGLLKFQHDSFYQSNPWHIHFNVANVVFMENDSGNFNVHVAKGDCHIVITLAEEAFKKIEELIYK